MPPPHQPPPPQPFEIMGADLVVTEKLADTPPIVNMACAAVSYDADDMIRTFTVSPLDIIPVAVV